MTLRHRRFLLVPLCLTALFAPVAGAQILASERATVSQVVDGTKIIVDYSRPRARGRTNIYGGLEKWGTTWTPGADDATTLDLSKPVTLLGRTIPTGKFSVWLVLREKEPWTLVLDPRADLFHTAHPDSTAQQLRLPVTPRVAAHTEVLTWEFPAVSISGTTLVMRWGTMAVDLPITVTPTLPLTITAERAAPYLGTYTVTWTDSTQNRTPTTFTVVREGERLLGRWTPPAYGSLPAMQLLDMGTDRFAYGFLRNEELWSTNLETTVRFTREGGAITGFVFGGDSTVAARGRRLR
jgi:hypothetical protein